MRRGVSLVEVLVATVIAGGALVTLYGLFGRGARVTDRAGMAFLASQLGREAIEELRGLPPADLERAMAQPSLLGETPAHPLTGLAALGRVKTPASAPLFARPDFHYPELYRRFRVSRTIARLPPRIAGDAERRYDVVVRVTWTEAGETRSGPADTTFHAVLTAGVQ